MCTAMSWNGCFGRTLDLEYSYQEQVAVLPRNAPLAFREAGTLKHHHAIIGMAHVSEGYPLYYDGVNEHGLAMAGLNFPGNAHYGEVQTQHNNIAPFELIPWILGQCATVEEAEVLLRRICLVAISFSRDLPLTSLHWMLSDRKRALVVEPMADGLKIYENPVKVMTNNPPFPEQLRRLEKFQHLTPEEPEESAPYGRGMGAFGLPGDWSSPSRFARAAFLQKNGAGEGVSRFFRLLGAVEQPEGTVRLKNGGMVRTVYTSCCHLERGVYYYTTYENHQITGVDLHREDLEGRALICYPLRRDEQILMEK